MSLLYWLPMTDGTAKNQGLSGATPTVKGSAVSNNNGKLGKCMQFGTAPGEILIPHQDLLAYSGPFSVSFWVNIISNPASYATVFAATGTSASWAQEFICFQRNGTNSTYIFVVSNGSSSTAAALSTDDLALNTWYHFTLVQDSNKKMYIYQNGILLRDYSAAITPNFAQIQNFKIGKSHTGYQGNFLINDFRFYTEALSPREIKELSKGMILHYKLDRGGFGGDNLMKTPNHKFYHNSNNRDTYPIIREWIVENGIEFERITRDNKTSNPNSFSVYGACPKEIIDTSVTAGMQVTATVWARCSHDQSNTYVTFEELGDSSTTNGVRSEVITMKAGQWTRFTVTKTLVYSYSDLRTGFRTWDMSIYGCAIPTGEIDNYYFDYRQDYKVEVGEIATPWTPNSADNLYSSMGLDDNVVYDVSGYGHNGTRLGALTYSSDTPRYNVSTHFTGTNYISLPSPSNEIKTISLWAKWDVIPSGQSVIFVDYKSKLGLGLMSTGILCGTSGVGSFYTYSKSSIVANKWYHFVIVNNGEVTGTARKLYIDGVEQTPTSNTSNWTYGVQELQIGKRSTTSDGFVGCLSDFRAYNTVLSADDILELYHTPETLSNNGILMTQGEYVEV